MDRRLPGLVVLVLAACAKGTLDNTTTFGVSFSPTQSASSADDNGDEDTGGTGGGSTSSGGDGDGDATTAASTAPVTTDPASSEGGPDSGGPLEESSSGGPITSMTSDPSTDDGMPPPPDVGPWEACDLADCEAGNDCITITGLRANAPYCSPECMVDDDCPLPPDGDALPVCALQADGAPAPTNCALLCEYDGVPYGTCPGGMACTDIPMQMTPISVCAWP